jgi:hypothetical protein
MVGICSPMVMPKVHAIHGQLWPTLAQAVKVNSHNC